MRREGLRTESEG